jgi:hypothetical protein
MNLAVFAYSNEELIYDLYNVEGKIGFVTSYDAEAKMIQFSYLYVDGGESFVVDVKFALDKETNGISKALVNITRYAKGC